MTQIAYKLYGMLMSGYSLKMRAYFRYRRIPFHWCNDMSANTVAETEVETFMVPVVQYPDGSYENDSTPIIDKLEAQIVERRTDPENEADAFLAYLIEDFADEWLLWPFFMLRWNTQIDKKFNSEWILSEVFLGDLESDAFRVMSGAWEARQTDLVQRLCGGPQKEEMLRQSLYDFLDIMERAVTKQRFLFGTRPSRAEISVFGQLAQLAQDHTSSGFMRRDYNRTTRWLGFIDDMSGCEGQWTPLSTDADRLSASPVAEMLALSAKYHLPLLQAHDDAMAKEQDQLSFDIDGEPFVREVHTRHQGCLPALQQRYRALSPDSKSALQTVLEETECLQYLNC